MVNSTWRYIPVRNDLTISQNIHLRDGNQAGALDHEIIRILVTIVVRYPKLRRLKPGTARGKLDLESGRSAVGCNRRAGLLNHSEVGAAGPLHPGNARQTKGTSSRIPYSKRPNYRIALENTTKVRIVIRTWICIPVCNDLTIAQNLHLRDGWGNFNIIEFTPIRKRWKIVVLLELNPHIRKIRTASGVLGLQQNSIQSKRLIRERTDQVSNLHPITTINTQCYPVTIIMILEFVPGNDIWLIRQTPVIQRQRNTGLAREIHVQNRLV